MRTAEVSSATRLSLASKAGLPLPSLFDRIILPSEIQNLYTRVCRPGTELIWDRLVTELGVETVISQEDLERVPRTGALLVVANHPFGMIEGALLGQALSKIRPDVKVLTNHLLSGIPGLAERCIWVDPIHPRRSPVLNRRGLREALEWLQNGRVLVVFPSGEVSSWDFRQRRIADPNWNDIAARLIRLTGTVALPIFIHGGNSLPFHLLGIVHPRLRTVQLTRELLNKRGRRIELAIGNRIPAEKVNHFGDSKKATRYLRWRTYLLRHRRTSKIPANTANLVPVSAAVDARSVQQEVASLSSDQLLVDSREFAVYVADAQQIPAALREIGRLRELTFRQVGEGSGKEIDLDEFDRYYQHLLLWSKANNELAGAYRIGQTTEILTRFGVRGLYTNTLFRFNREFFNKIGPALELGRSFIRPEYQRQHSSLLYLWKGIGAFVVRHCEAAVLFGPVSISNEYSPASRELLCRFFRDQDAGSLSRLARPRRAFRLTCLGDWDTQLAQILDDVELLSDPLADLEPDGKGIPILLKQYVRLGGKLLGFNVDRQFSDVLDGLILVDLRNTAPNHLTRYLGEEGSAAFLAYHGLSKRQASE